MVLNPTGPIPLVTVSDLLWEWLKVTVGALGVLSNHPVKSGACACVSETRNLIWDVCSKSKFHLTCHIPFPTWPGAVRRGGLELRDRLYIAPVLFVCTGGGDSMPLSGEGQECETTGTFVNGCQSSLSPIPVFHYPTCHCLRLPHLKSPLKQ